MPWGLCICVPASGEMRPEGAIVPCVLDPSPLGLALTEPVPTGLLCPPLEEVGVGWERPSPPRCELSELLACVEQPAWSQGREMMSEVRESCPPCPAPSHSEASAWCSVDVLKPAGILEASQPPSGPAKSKSWTRDGFLGVCCCVSVRALGRCAGWALRLGGEAVIRPTSPSGGPA